MLAMRLLRINHRPGGLRVDITLPSPRDGCTIDADVAGELSAVCAELQFADPLRVVTITGNGDAFAVGRMRPPAEVTSAPMAARLAWIASMAAANALAALPMPTIAVINGDARGHGLELALAADLRIAADTARFSIAGAGPADFPFPYDGGTQRLPRIVGPAIARDLLLTGRTLSGREALEARLVNRLASPADLPTAADELAAQVMAAAPLASRYAREAVAAAGELTLAQGLRLEADLSVLLHSTDDRAEGLRSFAEKRAPTFHGR